MVHLMLRAVPRSAQPSHSFSRGLPAPRRTRSARRSHLCTGCPSGLWRKQLSPGPARATDCRSRQQLLPRLRRMPGQQARRLPRHPELPSSTLPRRRRSRLVATTKAARPPDRRSRGRRSEPGCGTSGASHVWRAERSGWPIRSRGWAGASILVEPPCRTRSAFASRLLSPSAKKSQLYLVLILLGSAWGALRRHRIWSSSRASGVEPRCVGDPPSSAPRLVWHSCWSF
mmetsp:Transcript_2824/g.6628  ORF Transcript_2824/g.6628 Transcript_2824/m.6628 type:complete len:229 (-) Transcript_2824:200-886(-)